MEKNKVALITGGTGDIGTAIVKQLDSHYGKVIALDVITSDKASLWQAELNEHGYHQALYRRMDVTDFDQCKVVIDSIIQEFGRVDALINNAGITQDAVFQKCLNSNGMMFCV